ncbi:hypothetical protein AB0J43_57460 [Nonomuraea fuscirosea]
MTAKAIRRGLAVAVASLAAAGVVGTPAASASAHPVPGCRSSTFPGYQVQHVHLYLSDPAVAVCKAFKRIGGGRFQVFYKIKGRGGPRQVQIRNDGTRVRTYFVRGGTGTISDRLRGRRTFFRACRPDGTVCGPWL